MTDRERLIMLDTARGFTAPQIAERQGLSLFAVQHTLRVVKEALNASTAAHAVALTMALGYITREDVTS